MAEMIYDRETAALLVVDPYNDFISQGGKIWDRIKGVAEANDCVPNMLHQMYQQGAAVGMDNERFSRWAVSIRIRVGCVA